MRNNDVTQSISTSDPRFQQMLTKLEDVKGTASLTSFTEVLLLIGDMIERLTIHDRLAYKLGRFTSGKTGEIDLTPHGALQKGVSRIHAQLIMQDGKLYIMDMGSSNGTYVHKKRLKPQELSLVRKGDELLLGRMRIQVLFR